MVSTRPNRADTPLLNAGIGKALAERFIESGSYVIACGRRQANLDDLVHKHGSDKVSTVAFDITQLDAIPAFASGITHKHADLDCVFLNSGIQRPLDFGRPESVDIDLVNTEFVTNYLSYLALTKAFLPFLQAKTSPSGLIYTTSGLALVPITRCPNYCATKAAMHQFILILRKQLSKSQIKVIEIFPPAVQSE